MQKCEVASKYINRYLKLFVMKRIMADWDSNEMLEHILIKCKSTKFNVDNYGVKHHDLLLLY